MPDMPERAPATSARHYRPGGRRYARTDTSPRWGQNHVEPPAAGHDLYWTGPSDPAG